MRSGRCRMHDDTSPGAPKGNRNAWKHGKYSQKMLVVFGLVVVAVVAACNSGPGLIPQGQDQKHLCLAHTPQRKDSRLAHTPQ
jgi:hypothetical protein